MTEQHETKLEKAWNWVLKFTGLGVFVAAAATGGRVAFPIAFIGICVAVLSRSDVTAMLRGWRRGNGKEPE